tara:strand:+ start:59 stop:424 length:366 start_codon:yes stop_codon:yes gene_type:complete
MENKTKLNDRVKMNRGTWMFEWRGYLISFTRMGTKKPFRFTETWFDTIERGGKRFIEYETHSASISKSAFESKIKNTAEQYSNDSEDTFWRRCNDSPSIIRSRFTDEEWLEYYSKRINKNK